MLTTAPGLGLYTGNTLDGGLAGKGGVRYPQHAGVVLQAQARAPPLCAHGLAGIQHGALRGFSRVKSSERAMCICRARARHVPAQQVMGP